MPSYCSFFASSQKLYETFWKTRPCSAKALGYWFKNNNKKSPDLPPVGKGATRTKMVANGGRKSDLQRCSFNVKNSDKRAHNKSHHSITGSQRKDKKMKTTDIAVAI